MSVELFQRLPVLKCVSEIRAVVGKIASTFTSKSMSDERKEQVLPLYALKLFKNSFYFLALLSLLALPFVVSILLGDTFGIPVFDLLFSFEGILVVVVLAVVYMFLRSRRHYV